MLKTIHSTERLSSLVTILFLVKGLLEKPSQLDHSTTIHPLQLLVMASEV